MSTITRTIKKRIHTKNYFVSKYEIIRGQERRNNDITLYCFLVQSLYHLIFDIKKTEGKYFHIKNQMI